MPKTSLLVVINGPVATAASMPLLSKNIGINVPINAAIIITAIRAIQMVKDS
tara:strand:+ start:583 stop:738 length:156 start_codon:yes stop_codon:yes gene_type:complete